MATAAAAKSSVTVVGAGIIGASTALHLARRGVQVTVLDAAPLPGGPPSGATRASWAWVNANKKLPRSYRDLNLAGLNAWRNDADFRALIAPPSVCGGALLVGKDEVPGPPVDADYPHRLLSGQELAALEPHLDAGIRAGGATLWAQEAWADPIAATAGLLQRAQALGARVLLGAAVQRLLLDGEQGPQRDGGQADVRSRLGRRAVTGVAARPPAGAQGGPASSSEGEQLLLLPSDAVVVAAGVVSAALLQQAGAGQGLRLAHKPAVIATTLPLTEHGRLLHHMVSDGDTWVWQRSDLSFIIGSGATTDNTSREYGQLLLSRGAALLPALRAATLASVEVGLRPFPEDGHPVVGAVPGTAGLYVAATHSGFTLAPEVGRLVAEEVVHSLASPGPDAAPPLHEGVLGPYRPGRVWGSNGPAYGWKNT